MAFVPDPLPPPLGWAPGLVRALSDADRLIGRLAGEGGRLPNPHLLIRPFVRREAVLSSRIEGTRATLGELLAAEAGAAVDRSPADLREVANYVVALEYGVKFSGCTVHIVDEGVDTGPIVCQAVVPVKDDDSEETLAARILAEEHRIYSEAICLMLEDRVGIVGRRALRKK